MNETLPLSCDWNPTAEKIGETFVYCLIFLVSLAGNTVIGITVYKAKTMRKPINFLIVNMAISDLLFPIFLFPREIQKSLYADSWLTGGPLGQALCKLVFFLPDVSNAVSILSLVLIAVGRYGAVVFPFVLHSSVQSGARSSFSPLGSSRWPFDPHILSSLNLLNITEDWVAARIGKKSLEITLMRIISWRSPGEQSVNAGEQ